MVLRAETWAAIGAIAAVVQTVGLFVAWRTFRGESKARAVDRVMLLQTTLGAARSRLSTHFVAIAKELGDEVASRRHQPMATDLSNFGGRWGKYGDDVVNPEKAVPMQDLNRVLWCFERLDGSRQHEVVDLPLFHRLIGPHVMWWHAALANVDRDSNHLLESLDSLKTWTVKYRNEHQRQTEYHMKRMDSLIIRDFGNSAA
jgi:hypothetical protein